MTVSSLLDNTWPPSVLVVILLVILHKRLCWSVSVNWR